MALVDQTENNVSPEGPIASPPDDSWAVLASGALAYRLPPVNGKPIWLDAVLRVKLCEHGHSASQIMNWRRSNPARVKPEWETCDCTDMKGLTMYPKAKPELPTVAPAYHHVLWRNAQPVRLEPGGVWAVRVPGKPKGREVFIDRHGVPRCAHALPAHGRPQLIRARHKVCSHDVRGALQNGACAHC